MYNIEDNVSISLHSIPKTTSGTVNLIFAFLCHKNETVDPFIVFCDDLLSIDTKYKNMGKY